MTDCYKDICESLNIGHWHLNLEQRLILVDSYLQRLLKLPAPQLPFNKFFSIIINEQKKKLSNALLEYAETCVFHKKITFNTGKKLIRFEAVLNTPLKRGKTIIGGQGYMKLITIREVYDEEEHQQLALACKASYIYPWKWYLDTNVIEFTLYETSSVEKKIISATDFIETVDEDERKYVATKLAAFVKGRIDLLDLKFRSTLFSTEKRWFSVSGRIFHSEYDTKDCKAIGVAHDITRKKISQETNTRNRQLLTEAKVKAEAALNQRNIVLNNLSTALVYVNKDLIVQWGAMKSIKSLLGENAYEVGKNCYQSTFNKTEPCENCPLLRMFETKMPETYVIEKNGDILDVIANPVFNSNQELIGGVLKVEIITERIKQQNTIKHLNILMDAILNHIPVYLFVKNPNDNFRYIYWNKAIADSTGIPSSKVIGFTDEEIFGNKAEAEFFLKNDEDLLKSQEKIYYIEEQFNSKGELRVVNSLKTLIPAPTDKLPWLLGISWDITELKNNERELIKAKEKAEESNKLKSAFLANMSHEIRTPLNAIVGFSDLLAETTDESDKKEYIDIIRKNNELLLQLISDILDLSKIESQTFDFTWETVNIHEVVTQIIAASNLKGNKDVPVIFEQSIPNCYMYTDRTRLSQVISNFINNAQKFTLSGDIRVGYHMDGASKIRFYVKDTGIGIDRDMHHAIFDRFVKLNNFKQGTGLGLPICRSIIEGLQGTIGVNSEPGKGSCFWFTLPYHPTNTVRGDITSADTTEKHKILTRIKLKDFSETKPIVLVAEDIDSNFIFVNTALGNHYKLIRARNGKEAIELYVKNQPDIIIMDIKMPEMDGLQATQIIKEIDPDIPILALSAFFYDTDVNKARKAGCDDFINKPISAYELREKINDFFRT